MSDWTDDETISDTDCVDAKGFVWPEHDFQPGLTECTRCGAEALAVEHADDEPFEGDGYDHYMRDLGAVTGELTFKALATFVIGGLLYLTYWTAAHMLIKELLLLTFFDIFTFLSWARAYARSQTRVYDLRPPVVDDDPGEI